MILSPEEVKNVIKCKKGKIKVKCLCVLSSHRLVNNIGLEVKQNHIDVDEVAQIFIQTIFFLVVRMDFHYINFLFWSSQLNNNQEKDSVLVSLFLPFFYSFHSLQLFYSLLPLYLATYTNQ